MRRSAHTLRPGQPLVFMALVLAGWIGLRLAFGSLPFAPNELEGSLLASTHQAPVRAPVPMSSAAPEREAAQTDHPLAYPFAASPRHRELHHRPIPPLGATSAPPPRAASSPPARPLPYRPAQSGASHNLLWMAAMAHVPVPPQLAALLRAGTAAPVSAANAPPRALPRGFAGLDSWLFLRTGDGRAGAAPLAGPGPSYGASQAGVVARFRILAGRADPLLHLRATYAPSLGAAGASQAELAAGASVRPIPALPLAAHGEMRLTRQGGRTELRPAAFVTAGADALALPAGFAARAYGQAGWVGGRFATPFADGQVVADRRVAEFDLGELRAGAGAWGGAQKGAHRLDVGPSAALAVRLGDRPARLSLDYRHRIAGDAAPADGIALTLSRSF